MRGILNWSCLLCFFFVLGFFPKVSEAALINAIEFKGGGCVMSEDPGTCTSAEATIKNYVVSVTKDFSKVESEDHEEGGGGGKGACKGSGGPSGTSGHTDTGETHEHDELFEKLPPIHMFLTLENSGNENGDTYTFDETIFNNTNMSWDGFYFALKQNEDGRAKFQFDSDPTSDIFGTYAPDDKLESKKLTWTNGLFAEGEKGTFSFDVTFYDVAPEYLKDGSQTFSVMLQEFPMAAAAPVPEPATMLLFGTGIVGLAGARFRKKKSNFFS